MKGTIEKLKEFIDLLDTGRDTFPSDELIAWALSEFARTTGQALTVTPVQPLEEKIQQAIERRREVTFSASENTEGFVTCLLYSRAKGGVSEDGATLAEALDAALAQLPEKAPREGGAMSNTHEPTTDDGCVVPHCQQKQSVYGSAPLCPTHRAQHLTPEECDIMAACPVPDCSHGFIGSGHGRLLWCQAWSRKP